MASQSHSQAEDDTFLEDSTRPTSIQAIQDKNCSLPGGLKPTRPRGRPSFRKETSLLKQQIHSQRAATEAAIIGDVSKIVESDDAKALLPLQRPSPYHKLPREISLLVGIKYKDPLIFKKVPQSSLKTITRDSPKWTQLFHGRTLHVPGFFDRLASL